MNIIKKAKYVLLMRPGSRRSRMWNVPVWAYLAFAAYLTWCVLNSGLVKASDLASDLGQYMQTSPYDSRQMQEMKFHYNNNVYLNQKQASTNEHWNGIRNTLNGIGDNIRNMPTPRYNPIDLSDIPRYERPRSTYERTQYDIPQYRRPQYDPIDLSGSLTPIPWTNCQSGYDVNKFDAFGKEDARITDARIKEIADCWNNYGMSPQRLKKYLDAGIIPERKGR